jgi:hypothetical protein
MLGMLQLDYQLGRFFTSSIRLSLTEANKRRELGTSEKVSLRRINFESNTYLHGSNARNLPI